MAVERTGLRERKNERTRAAITRAACELILERGFERTTIAQIAERADVAPRTVHTWFASKDDIVLSGFVEPLDRLTALLAGGAGDTVDRIERWMQVEGELVSKEDDLGVLRFRALSSDPHLRALEHERLSAAERAIADAVAADAGVAPDGLAARAFAGAAISLLLGLRDRFVHADSSSDPDGLQQGFALLRGGLEAPRAAR